MSFEAIKHFLSKNEHKPPLDTVVPPTPILTEEPDKVRETRNKFARFSSRIKAA